MDGNSTAWSMPSASMSARRADGVGPARAAPVRGDGTTSGSENRGPGGGEGAEGDGQDLGAAHHDVLVAVGVARDDGPVRLGDRLPRGAGLDDVPVGVDDRARAERSRRPPGRRAAGPSSAPVVGAGQRVAEQPRRVARRHHAQLVVGKVPERLLEHGLGVGPGRVGVGVVALHHDVVDADAVAQLDDRRVVDGAEPEVAAQDLARAQLRRPGECSRCPRPSGSST